MNSCLFLMRRLSRYLLLFILGVLSAGVMPHRCYSETAQPPLRPLPETAIVITAVGDVMMPASIQKAVAQHRYDYGLLFEKIAPDLSSADIVFANLETPVDHKAAATGYPTFNARPELLVALKKTGVGIVSVANNHALDKGVKGLKRTLDNIEKAGILFVGAGRMKDEAERTVITNVRGITTAFLGYTYGVNGRSPKQKKDAAGVHILQTGSEEDLARAVADVQAARAKAELVVVSLHWGDEYRTVPTRWQRRVAAGLIEAGADLILGHHPHVLQPVESYAARDGRQGLIAYSLGNFISSQNYGISERNKDHVRALRGDGIILNVYAAKEQGKVVIRRAEFLPIWSLRDQVGKTSVFRPVNLDREIALREGVPKRTAKEESTLKLLNHRRKVIIGRLSEKPSKQQQLAVISTWCTVRILSALAQGLLCPGI